VEGVWVLITADLAIFCLLFGSFMHERTINPAQFEASRLTLNFNFGGVDTLILLTSSWFVAIAVQLAKRDELKNLPRYLVGGFGCGILFMISKLTEYFEKFFSGITPATNPFYMWYFTLTGLHLMHVIVGSALLCALWVKSRRGLIDSGHRVFLESVASFWHLVDLLWILIFPLLYLVR
jgi:nitric oxide reductase NorE protein